MEIIELAATGRSLQARTASAGTAGGSLLVALHGGGYQATYFEAADGNLHETAARESLGCAAITRPGYCRRGTPFDAAARIPGASVLACTSGSTRTSPTAS
jgi:hypothetical protein